MINYVILYFYVPAFVPASMLMKKKDAEKNQIKLFSEETQQEASFLLFSANPGVKPIPSKTRHVQRLSVCGPQ